MNFDPFVIPFNIGLYFILFYVVIRCVKWFMELSKQDKLRLQRGFFGRPFWSSVKEIFMESLLHRRIWKENPRLGYMHTSFAFGWFLLIVFGTIEADIFSESHLNPAYRSIFFKFFHPEAPASGFERAYEFLMDLILAYILSGLIIAIIKRFRSKIVGMKKTTKLKTVDKVALACLWMVFPSRLMAESLTSAVYDSGSFLTGSLGHVFASFLPCEPLSYVFWWMYSLALFGFFILLPITRYMHIPIEMFLIFARNSGIGTGDKENAYMDLQVYSCSSCGICISNCQLSTSAGINNIQTAYLMKAIRNGEDVSNIIYDCLMCGRCEEKCPVKVESLPIRMIKRRNPKYEPEEKSIINMYLPKKRVPLEPKASIAPSYTYLPKPVAKKRAKVAYFAGCMTHLTPSIKKAMIDIFNAAGVDFIFVDEDGGVCCGRPLMLAGEAKKAKELMKYNSELFDSTGADILVTSCPICYKVFKESYSLKMEVMHHTQFIKKLILDDDLRLKFTNVTVSYHSPCELGRGTGVYEEPKDILKYVACLQSNEYEDGNSLCCGGSLANTKIEYQTKLKIAKDAAAELTKQSPDYLATACPMCKKTLAAATDTKVVDVAELVANAIESQSVHSLINNKSWIEL